MKKLLMTLLLIGFSTSAFADCTATYKKAAKNRTTRNAILIGTGALALAAPMAVTVFATTATVSGLSAAAYYTGLMTLAGPLPMSIHANTNFDKVIAAVNAAKSQEENDDLSKLLNKVAKESDTEITPEQTAKLKSVLVDAFESDVFCPVVGTNRKGVEKRAAFTRNAVAKYLSNYLNGELK